MALRIHAEENKRRTLQRSDIAAAITKTDMFDFLIDIVPREEFKMGKDSKAGGAAAATAGALGEHRRSQESFPSIGSNAGGVPSGLHPAGLEGYPYAYGILEGSYMVKAGFCLLIVLVFVLSFDCGENLLVKRNAN